MPGWHGLELTCFMRRAPARWKGVLGAASRAPGLGFSSRADLITTSGPRAIRTAGFNNYLGHGAPRNQLLKPPPRLTSVRRLSRTSRGGAVMDAGGWDASSTVDV